MAKLCRYEEAITNYRKAMTMRPKPRFTDCENAVSQIYEILGNIPAAIEMRKEELRVVREDWTTEGEWTDSIYREIHRLEELL